jgi:hypothetical protein
MRTKQPQNGCESGCGAIANERNRYFTGKFMAARDFQAEQDYFLSRHRLHNRLLHGWGIVCGLEVKHHPDKERRPGSECALRWVIVNAGVAVDCCGRELTLPAQTAFELPLPRKRWDSDDAQQNNQSDNAPPDENEMREPFLLVLRYGEEEVEQVPALFAEDDCDPARKQANRVREKARLDVVRLADVESDCWRAPQGKPKEKCIDDCPDPLPGPSGACLDPICPCGHTVPLALIEFDPDCPGEGFEIKTRGRRRLPPPPHLLTHIVSTNWKHGGEISLKRLREKLGGRLEITFDRKLLEGDGSATGVNGFTFIVQYGGIQHDIEFLPFEGRCPPRLEDECRAVFTIDPDYIGGKGRDNIAGNVVYVTLKCDFILDCHEIPVDGDHLGGMLPSGDGVPGGVFESWFRVVHEDRYPASDEEEEKWQQQA